MLSFAAGSLGYLSVEHGPHDGVEGALGDEVVDVHGAGLSDAVGAVLRLLDVAWVPVELCEHNVAGRCECQALRKGTRRPKHWSRRVTESTLFETQVKSQVMRHKSQRDNPSCLRRPSNLSQTGSLGLTTTD